MPFYFFFIKAGNGPYKFRIKDSSISAHTALNLLFLHVGAQQRENRVPRVRQDAEKRKSEPAHSDHAQKREHRVP